MNYAKKYPKEVALTGIELYANGRRLGVDEAPMQTGKGGNSKKLLDALRRPGPEGLKNIRAWIKSLVDLRWSQAWHVKKPGLYMGRYDSDFYQYARQYLSNRLGDEALGREEELLAVGDLWFNGRGTNLASGFLTQEEESERRKLLHIDESDELGEAA